MSPSKISKRIFLVIAQITSLPLSDRDAFMSDSRNLWTAESCLRRALEALFDVGRHILAGAFGKGVSEYKEIASGLLECGVLTAEQKAQLSILAGYRNRMVHFELQQICAEQLGDITAIQDALLAWYDRHQELVDPAL
jgi:uncharacterized protein YutE (UPF0331/DUF86 family)